MEKKKLQKQPFDSHGNNNRQPNRDATYILNEGGVESHGGCCYEGSGCTFFFFLRGVDWPTKNLFKVDEVESYFALSTCEIRPCWNLGDEGIITFS